MVKGWLPVNGFLMKKDQIAEACDATGAACFFVAGFIKKITPANLHNIPSCCDHPFLLLPVAVNMRRLKQPAM